MNSCKPSIGGFSAATPCALALLSDTVLQSLAESCGRALEKAFDTGDREAAVIFMRAMNDLTRLRCVRKGVLVDIQSVGVPTT